MADIFTKGLPLPAHRRHIRGLGLGIDHSDDKVNVGWLRSGNGGVIGFPHGGFPYESVKCVEVEFDGDQLP